eukprot:gene4782-7367_t
MSADFALLNSTLHDMVNQRLDEVLDTIDTLWILCASFFVFIMQVGFAFFEAGSVRSVNVITIVFKNVGDCTIGAILWWIVGYRLAGPGNPFIGSVTNNEPANTADFLLAYMYLATASTIISGAVAERVGLTAYYAITFFVCGFSYPVVVHWVWCPAPAGAGGWLYDMGAIDFAGSLVVHMSSGVYALVAAAMLGPRILPGNHSPFSSYGKHVTSPHNKFLQAAGAMILWLGWFGFNAGATKSFTRNYRTAETAAVSTALAGSSGAVFGILYTRVMFKAHDLSHVCNALLSALVTVTASCGVIEPWVAVVIGCLGAWVYFLFHKFRVWCRVDDVIDASAVHGACGMVGTFCVCLADKQKFSTAFPNHPFEFNLGQQLFVQAVAVLAVGTWSAVGGLSSCYLLKRIGIFRVPLEAELTGCDGSLFQCYGYDYIGDVLTNLAPSVRRPVVDELSDNVSGSEGPPVEYPEAHGIQLLGVQVHRSGEDAQPSKFSFLKIEELLHEAVEKWKNARTRSKRGNKRAARYRWSNRRRGGYRSCSRGSCSDDGEDCAARSSGSEDRAFGGIQAGPAHAVRHRGRHRMLPVGIDVDPPAGLPGEPAFLPCRGRFDVVSSRHTRASGPSGVNPLAQQGLAVSGNPLQSCGKGPASQGRKSGVRGAEPSPASLRQSVEMSFSTSSERSYCSRSSSSDPPTPPRHRKDKRSSGGQPKPRQLQQQQQHPRGCNELYSSREQDAIGGSIFGPVPQGRRRGQCAGHRVGEPAFAPPPDDDPTTVSSDSGGFSSAASSHGDESLQRAQQASPDTGTAGKTPRADHPLQPQQQQQQEQPPQSGALLLYQHPAPADPPAVASVHGSTVLRDFEWATDDFMHASGRPGSHGFAGNNGSTINGNQSPGCPRGSAEFIESERNAVMGLVESPRQSAAWHYSEASLDERRPGSAGVLEVLTQHNNVRPPSRDGLGSVCSAPAVYVNYYGIPSPNPGAGSTSSVRPASRGSLGATSSHSKAALSQVSLNLPPPPFPPPDSISHLAPKQDIYAPVMQEPQSPGYVGRPASHGASISSMPADDQRFASGEEESAGGLSTPRDTWDKVQCPQCAANNWESIRSRKGKISCLKCCSCATVSLFQC